MVIISQLYRLQVYGLFRGEFELVCTVRSESVCIEGICTHVGMYSDFEYMYTSRG